jgi:tRNA uridine 5-carboxymethylaminomethyl modification enzyme
LLLRADSADLRLSDHAYRLGLISEQRYGQVVEKRERIQRTIEQLGQTTFTSSRPIEASAQELGFQPLNQLLSAQELLRRPEVSYQQVASLAQRVQSQRESIDTTEVLPELDEDTASEVELQVKYEIYVRKQEQMVNRTARLEEMRIPETVDYLQILHLRTEARQKLIRTRPRTVGQAARVEGVTPADVAILMIYLERLRALKASY